ncbi:flagellar hook protein FlgE [Pandoraea thiooxydans]|uniref:Flagellar hook protein FlgE n=1 Tax=Pandoraea thiooxydans TaxID=445709 RepID=A0A0G3EWE4_9BURK|nr:flagellar hook protein FlgE [Pandoraea thiooxydans]AKJ69712.1 flagellar hook protein FlgE [Pandoraea thiooxydans]
MSFSTALSGLDAASQNLDVIGNNVANASTVGFKEGEALFSDIYANSMSGSGNNQIGMGTRVTGVEQQFTQGDPTVTNQSLDLAINGNGLFRLNDNGTTVYSRNGQFQLDKNGYIVNANGDRLTGYGANTTGVINSVSPQDLQIPTGYIAPMATSTIAGQFNLDSRTAAIPSTTAFNPADTTTYTNGTSVNVYDSLGNQHSVNLYFVNRGPDPVTGLGTWNVYGTIDGSTPIGTAPGLIDTLQFNTAGGLASGGGPITLPTISYGNGSSSVSNMTLTLNGTTQYGSTYAVNALQPNGYATGQLSGFTIGTDGIITGTYSNGQSATLGQVALANFNNPQGLVPTGNNAWVESATSGAPKVGVPGSSNLGSLQSGAVESSNVNLTAELVNMITAQRNYQANAQTIKTENQLVQTLVNL